MRPVVDDPHGYIEVSTNPQQLAFCCSMPQKSPNSKRLRGSSMPDFTALRRTMVDGQVRTNDVTDRRLLAAMLDLPRERFVRQQKVGLAYLDLDIPVSEPGRPARWLLKPMVLAKLLHAAEIGESDRVL